MKILIYPEYSIPSGGTLTFLIKLLDINFRNNIGTTLVIEKNKKSNIIEEIIKNYKIEVLEIPSRPRIFFKPYFSVLFELWIWFCFIRKIEYDIFFVSNGTPWLNLGYILIVKKMIYFMHTYPQGKFGWKASFMFKLTKCLSKKKCIATVSNYSINKISERMKVAKEKIHLIYNSYDSKMDSVVRNTDYPVVLTVGHVVDYKNPEIWLKTAIKVISENPEIKFWWVGDGELIENYKNRVIELGIDHNIQFFGNSNNISYYYSKAAVYFQPSLIESHGIAVVEAMKVGIPCVVSRVGGMTESVFEGMNGFVCDANDYESYANNIIDLISDKDLSFEYGNAGKRIAKEKFHESIQEFKILNLFKTINN